MLTIRDCQKLRQRGMTLVELMVTLTVLGLLLLAGLPSMSQWMRNSQIRTVAEALQNGLTKARNEAVRRNTRVRFSLVNDPRSGNCALSSTTGSWVVSLQDPAGACDTLNPATAPMILERWAQSEGSSNVTVQVMSTDCSTNATQTQVAFDGFGRLNTATAPPIRCLNVTHGSGTDNRALRLTVSAAGNVRMCDPAVTDSNDPRRC